MSIFRSGKLHEADTDSLKLKIPRAKEFDKESSVTNLKGENKNITSTSMNRHLRYQSHYKVRQWGNWPPP